jgi:acyl carrier protein
MKNRIEERIKNVMSAVFEIAVNKFDEDSSPDNIESWDSLNHMKLVVALEEEFNVQFTDVDITELINMKLIIAVLLEKLPIYRS